MIIIRGVVQSCLHHEELLENNKIIVWSLIHQVWYKIDDEIDPEVKIWWKINIYLVQNQ